MDTKLPEQIKQSLTEGVYLEAENVNGFVDGVVREVLAPLNKSTKYEPLSYITLAKMAEMCSLFRLKVDNGNGSYVPANMFLVNFMDSGVGKNYPITALEQKIFSDYIELYEKRISSGYNDLVNEIKEKQKEDDNIQPTDLPNYPNRVLDPRNTVQGLHAQRETLEAIGLGGHFLQISEFSRFLEYSGNANMDMFISFLDLFDMGDHEARAIKSERVSKSVKSVPANGIFHTSLEAFEKKSKTAEAFENIMADMLGRRSVFTYNTSIKEDKTKSYIERANKNLNEKAQIDETIYKETVKNILSIYGDISNVAFTLNNESNLLIEIYRLYNLDRSEEIKDSVLKSNIRGRYWTARKLSGVLAVFNHPGDRVVSPEDALEAIHYIEVAGNQLQAFRKRERKLGGDQIFEFLLENLGRPQSKTDLRKRVYSGSQEGFYNWYRGSIDDAIVIAERKGYKLKTDQQHSTGISHYLIKIDD